MISLRSKPARAQWLLAFGLLTLAAGAMLGGEKIQFSNRSDAQGLPEPERKEKLLAPALDLLKGSDQAGGAADLLLRPGTPGMGNGSFTPSKKQKEALDRRKNWVFDTPEPRDKQRGKSDELAGRDEEATDVDKKPKSVLERYLERESQKSARTTNAPTASGFANRPDGKGAFFSPAQTGAGATAAPAGGGSQFDLSGSARGLGKEFSYGSFGGGDLKGAGSRLGSDLRERMKEREARVEEFRKLFDSPVNASGRAGEGGSPLTDAARTGGTSLRGRGFEDFTRRSTFSEALNPARNFNSGGSAASAGGLTDFSAPASGAGYAPAFSPQPNPLRVEPKPAVLEIPKRKF